MNRFDLAVIVLVLYLGLSAWAYRDIGVRRTAAPPHESAHPHKSRRTHASFWQLAASIIAICTGALAIAAGGGLIVKGLFGISNWTIVSLGPLNPVGEIVLGLLTLAMGVVLVHETRYSIIRHPRPPRKFTKRFV